MAVKFSIDDVRKVGKVVRESDVYTVIDVSNLEHLTASLTILHPGKETSGHSHEMADEVYFFLEGKGEIQVGQERYAVKKGDVILIPRGNFHKTFNHTKSDIRFLCVFEKYEGRS
jgi:mannose-6-phosphate isomerase-like protein (cupin superfamily)